MKNKFLIISGISGAGKSQVLNLLEDFGYVCVDNMPFEFVSEFIKLYKKKRNEYKNVALSIDVRAGKNINKITDIIAELQKEKIANEVFFLNADDGTILKRYSETRRRHPLGLLVKDGIKAERKMLQVVQKVADREIDTTNMTIGELKNTLAKLIGLSSDKRQLLLSIMSFGFKYGIAAEADIVFDVRFVPNPNYVSGLKTKTGKDFEVVNYIEKQKEYKPFFNKISQLLKNLIPGYIKEGKSQLTIAVGCTGGRHRSVATAEKLAKFFIKNKFKVKLYHRDIFRAG